MNSERMDFSIDSLDGIKYPNFESTAINYQTTAFSKITHSIACPDSIDVSMEKSSVVLKKDFRGDDLRDNFHPIPPSSSQGIVACSLIPTISTSPGTTSHNSARHGENCTNNGEDCTNKNDAPNSVECELLDKSPQSTTHSRSAENQVATTITHVTLLSSHDSLPSTKLTGPAAPDSTTIGLSPVVKTRVDAQSNSSTELMPSLYQRRNVISQEEEREGLSPWEKWMIKKAKEELDKKGTMKKEKLAKQECKLQVMKATELKRQKAARIHAEWVQQKNAQELAKKMEDRKRSIALGKAEEQRKQATLVKAATSYNEWYSKTEKQRIQQKQQNREKAKEKATREKELRLQSEHAYKVWLRTVGTRKVDRGLIYPT